MITAPTPRALAAALLLSCAPAAPVSAQPQQSPAPSPPAQQSRPSAQPSPKPAQAGEPYESVVARLKGGDRNVDFRAMRMAYAESKSYSPYGGGLAARRAMFAALNSKNFDEALKQAEKVLEGNYVDIMAHIAAQAAHRELGHADQADFHRFVARGLINSILESGDGRKEETAYVVISTDEEYALFQVLGLRPTSQSLANKGGHSYDVMQALDPKTNQAVTYYFNIDKPFNWLGNSLKH